MVGGILSTGMPWAHNLFSSSVDVRSYYVAAFGRRRHRSKVSRRHSHSACTRCRVIANEVISAHMFVALIVRIGCVGLDMIAVHA